jgi:hypothetical protein
LICEDVQYLAVTRERNNLHGSHTVEQLVVGLGVKHEADVTGHALFRPNGAGSHFTNIFVFVRDITTVLKSGSPCCCEQK